MTIDLSEDRYRELRERESVLLALLEEVDGELAEHNRVEEARGDWLQAGADAHDRQQERQLRDGEVPFP